MNLTLAPGTGTRSTGESRPITVAVAGDFCPTPEVERLLLSGCRDAGWFLGEAASFFRRCDLGLVNQECVLTVSGTSSEKEGPCLKAHPETVTLLTHLGVSLVTSANNHIRDFGDAGVRETLTTLRTHKIDTVGAGETLQAARNIYYHTVGGRMLAVINVAESEFAYATRSRAGANPLDLIDLLTDITEARRQANHVLLIVHGGLEFTHYPSPNSVKLMRFLAEQGVTAIIRHHPHFIQGYEVWKGVPILYSLGNFLYFLPNESVPGWRDGMVVELRIDADNSCNFLVHGFEQCFHEPRLIRLDGNARELFLSRIDEYCKVLRDPVALEREWSLVLTRRRKEYYGSLTLPTRFVFRVFRKLGWLGRIRPSRRKRLLFENWLRCEAHRETLLDIFEEERIGASPPDLT